MNTPLPRVRLADAHVRPHLDFVLPGLLAGSVGLIVGQGAVGKSFLALHIGIAVATQTPVAGMPGITPGPRGPVTILAGEDPPEILRERLYWLRQYYGIDDDEQIDEMLDVRSASGHDMRILCRSGSSAVRGPFYGTLRDMCVGQRLVIVDPLAFLSDIDENDNGGMTVLMQTLSQIARETGTTIIALHHVSKSGEGEREEWTAARGASALTTACRWQMYLRPPTKSEAGAYGIDEEMRSRFVRVALVKSNYGALPEPVFLHRLAGGVLEYQEMFRRKKKTAASGKEADDDWR